MLGNRGRDTRPELALRSRLHRSGFRYRVDRSIALDDGRVRPDLVFVSARVAVFVDGCFWHGCPAHGTSPRRNSSYWAPKLATNRQRDARQREALQRAGWLVPRRPEHEDPAVVAEMVATAVRGRRRSSSS